MSNKSHETNTNNPIDFPKSDPLYHNYHIYYDPPPIPYRGADWHYYHKDYDGPGDSRHGHCASEQACKDEIDEILADEGY
jgi:hypothetical protein